MKQQILKLGTIITIVFIGIFTSCTKKKEKQNVGIIAKKETINKNTVIARKPIVFITGNDKNNSSFYDSARVHFKKKNFQIVNEAYSLEEIISWMNKNITDNPYGEIHIVNSHNPLKGLNLETTVGGKKVTANTLQKSILNGSLPRLKKGINSNTKVILHSNGLGKNVDLLNGLKKAFSTKEVPQILASSYFTVFGGQFSNHYLAKPYYVYYPTANSPGKMDLSKEIAKKYPAEKEIEWFDALTNERERYIGEAYTKQYNIPIKWKIDYTDSDDDVPTFVIQEEIMDYIANSEDLADDLNKLNIPLEKFRWTYTIKNNKLIIKGKTSALCVLKPLTKPFGDLQHIKPDTNNKRLYAMK